ncbi:hypothetical protein H072_5127 [Dactylellina haptotyla CBS 200.50]|uniref:F-box domain-containing protein n=1 Tax=Dactylellina haptotyla (strain CBS 200.50) TaxID=1284197 RepID=S8BNE3_DACHA|nr:hypothetical protein H072_5127 [Dactylellina haptotyla CBS 200.50]
MYLMESPQQCGDAGMQPSTLLSLPEELLESICQIILDSRPTYSFNWQQPVVSLSYLSRTSKKIYRIATPVLYSTFDTRHVHKVQSQIYAKFLRTLFERPHLAKQVRRMYLKALYFRLADFEEYQQLCLALADSLGLAISRSIHDTYRSSFQGSSSDGGYSDEDDEPEVPSAVPFQSTVLGYYEYATLVQLLIALVPNLRVLYFEAREVECTDRRMGGSFIFLEELAKTGRASLLHLEEFAFSHNNSDPITFDYIHGILDLSPNIRSILAEPCDDPVDYHSDKPIGIQNVTSLKISGCLSKEGLRTIVSSRRSLEVFEHTHHTKYTDPDPPPMTPREAIEILDLHKHFLRVLKLDLRFRNNHRLDGRCKFCFEGHQIVTLKGFSQLESFEVDGSSILFPQKDDNNYHTEVLVNMLPRSIRCLSLQEVQKEGAANAITLLEHRSAFPFLNKLILFGNLLYSPLSPDPVTFPEHELEVLRQLTRAAGITFLKPSFPRSDSSFQAARHELEEW